MTSPIAHFNGELLPLDEIRVSPLDRGFIFGDGVYEVIPAYGGRLLRAREHFSRLQRSMDEIRLANPHTVDGWIHEVDRLLAHHPGNQAVYIQVTRGVPPKRDHVIPKGLAPTVFMMATPLSTPSPEMVEKGVACVTAKDFRWEKCHIKSTSLLGNVLARQVSADAGATETILFRDGFLTEAAASNVFVVKGGKVAAAPQDNHILLGITYELLTELAREGWYHALPDLFNFALGTPDPMTFQEELDKLVATRYFTEGELLRQQGKTAEARKCYDRCLKLDPMHSEAAKQRAALPAEQRGALPAEAKSEK